MKEIQSKAWQWDEVDDDYWLEPAQQVHYLAYRWQKHRKMRVLDLGCGLGRHSLFLAEKGFDIQAFDLSDYGIGKLAKAAQDKGLSIKTQIGDMLVLPYPDASLDSVLAFRSIYHTNRQGIEKVISEIERVLNGQGEAYLSFISKRHPAFSNPESIHVDDYTCIETRGAEKGVPHYYVDEAEIRRLLVNFRILSFLQIEEIREQERSWHYFVLVSKN